jgi:ribosomal protein S12 methylthiotransferase accessory factor YcaO
MLKKHIVRLGSSAMAELSPVALFPTLSKAVDSYGQPAFSTTYHHGNAALLGELIERQHFFSGVNPESYGNIQENCSESFCNAFLKLIKQTCPTAPHNVNSYNFELTRCLNLMTEQEESIPTLLISLGSSKDDFWVPDRDTSGCASHSDPEKTFEAALMEFLERQNLTASWILDQCRYKVALGNQEQLPPAIQNLLKYFMTYGTVYVVNTSLLFSCYSIIIVFIAFSDEEHVKFSIGSACSLVPNQALQKAVLEMCQSFTLMSEAHSRVDPSAYEKYKKNYQKLTRNFCDSNTREMIKDFPYLLNSCTPNSPIESYLKFPVATIENILQEMSAISKNVFYYSTVLSPLDQCCFLGRIISPDFFITMDNHTPSFNLKNRFSEQLNIKVNKNRSLPFS